MTMPDGLVPFLTSGDMNDDPDVVAGRLLEMGAIGAWVLTSSVDGRFQPVSRVEKICGALRARNVHAGLYFFPVDATTLRHEAHLDECAKATGILDVCADIEPWHEKDDMRTPVNEDEKHDWDEVEVFDMFVRLRAKGYKLSLSVFPRNQWKRFDWRLVLGGEVDVWLQLYMTIAGPVIKLAKELEFWRAQGITVVICVGSYLGDAARFRRDLHVAEEHSAGVQQLGCWALGTTDKPERAAALMFVVEAWPAP